ncbi:MAG: hypothetical protein N2444_06905 [Methylocystis sp.]|nr:hypothetical protein [Methylocystis sp.]
MTTIPFIDSLLRAIPPAAERVAAFRSKTRPPAKKTRYADILLDYLPYAIAALLVAGVVHIVSVLLMPAVAPRDALARLGDYVGRVATQGKSDMAGGGLLVLLPPIKSGSDSLPFEDPAFEEAVCVYDLTNGPLRILTNADDDELLALSFHANGGRIYHSMTDRSAIKGKIDIVVGDAAQIDALAAGDEEEGAAQEIRLTAPTKRGFVFVRSFAKRPSDHARARERLKSVLCEKFELPTE